MFCPKCGKQVEDGSTFCPLCGAALNGETVYAPSAELNPDGSEKKSKVAAGILGILLGHLGIHNFYLGYTGKAIGQLVLTVVGWILSIALGFGLILVSASAIWGLIEGIMILTGSIKVDGKGNTLKS
ncbi:MAG: TM2 domain-containing protein [Clostridia bacterium]|nr:TM2 domain-containing protein [Clostridia bacterium]